MLTVVLDDDPTGTQSASAVQVLLDWDDAAIAAALRAGGAVYLQTNSRALTEDAAVDLAQAIQGQIRAVSQELGQPVLVVLRGDSTLRGHVFAESDVFAAGRAPILFVPAFPDGGRTTLARVHRARIDGVDVPVGETEFARDPVFGYRSSDLVSWTREVGQRRALPVLLDDLRASRGQAVADALAAAGPGELVVPDVLTDADIDLVHAGLLAALAAGHEVVVRAAAPLASRCAGCASTGYLPRPLQPAREGILIVCGSHTAAATAQLDRLAVWAGLDPILIGADEALADPLAAGRVAAEQALDQLASCGMAILGTARVRRPEDDTLAHGARMMDALIAAAAPITPRVGTVVTKGGITSAEVARRCFVARTAHVRGQLAPGISVWDLPVGGSGLQVIVPGNVGGVETLTDVVAALGYRPQEE